MVVSSRHSWNLAYCPTGLTSSHAALHDHDILRVPHLQDGHAGDRRVGLECDGVDSVIRADDQHSVDVLEVVVDLVHLKHDWALAELKELGLAPEANGGQHMW